jgi:hypothetical protein
LPTWYVLQAIEHGKRLKFEQLHYESYLPAKQLEVYCNANSGKDSPPRRMDDFLFFKQAAFPENAENEKYPLIGRKAVDLVTRSPYAPQWLGQIMPLQEILNVDLRSVDPPEKLAYISPDLVLFAPVIIGDWVEAPISAFKTPGRLKGESIDLYDFDDDQKLMTVRLLETKDGYMTRGMYQILWKKEEVVAHG